MDSNEMLKAKARAVLGRAAAAVYGRTENNVGPRVSASTMAAAVVATLRSGAARCEVCDVPVNAIRTVVGRVVVRCARHAMATGRHARSLADRQSLVKTWLAGEVR